MKITKKHCLSILILFVLLGGQFFLIQPLAPVHAASDFWNEQEGLSGGTIGEAFGSSEEPKKDVRVIVATIIKIFLGFLGIIFLVLLILAGFKYMTAQGNEEKVTEAISQIKAALIGLIIILAAYSITHFVTNYLTKATTGSVWP